jgi:hypothetical protein
MKGPKGPHPDVDGDDVACNLIFIITGIFLRK